MLNQAQIIGHLGKDPESRVLPSGDAVSNFSVATTEKWKDKSGQQQEHTEWHRISAFGKLAEICNQYLEKGMQVFVQGKIQTRKYKAEDGTERYSTEIKADTMKMLGRKDGGGDHGAQQATQHHPAAQAQRPTLPSQHRQPAASDLDDDIPF